MNGRASTTSAASRRNTALGTLSGIHGHPALSRLQWSGTHPGRHSGSNTVHPFAIDVNR